MKNPKLLRQISDYTLSFKNLIVLFLLFGYFCVNGQMANTTETFTTTPGSARIIPFGVTNITVGIWGGGGAGGGCSANNNNAGGGGAGGSYTFSVLPCNPFDSVYVIIGAGGLGVSGGAGGAGGFSRVTVRNGAIISSATANGGLGGGLGSGNNGAGAGAATTIGVTHNGGAGAAGTGTGGGASGGGGGGAGSGGSGSNANASIGGIGGIGVTPGGNGANGSATAGNGTSATALSGGGAGARNGGGGVARTGGNGFRGQVIIFYGASCSNGTITLTSAMGTDNQNFCLGNALTNITYSVGGDSTAATLSAGAFPNGVMGSFNAGVYTITGTPTEFGIFNYTITTTGSDPCSEASVNGTITVLEVPQATFATVSDITVSCETIPTESSLSYTNNNMVCPISGTALSAITGGPLNICGATFTETWTFTDQFGRTSTRTRNITTSPAPIAAFTLPLPQDITIDCASGAPSPSALAYSNGLMTSCQISGSVNSTFSGGPFDACGSTLTESWTYTDACNRPITHSRAITIDDNIAPSITLLGIPNITISPCSNTYNDAGATAEDNCLGDITNDIVVNNPLSAMQPFAYVPGVYTITYNVSDNCNNMATQVTRTVTVSPYATKADGNYGSVSTWEGECIPPNPIPNGVTVNISHNVTNIGTLTNNGIITSSLPFTNEGTYQGNGTFQGPEFINNGIVNPGN